VTVFCIQDRVHQGLNVSSMHITGFVTAVRFIYCKDQESRCYGFAGSALLASIAVARGRTTPATRTPRWRQVSSPRTAVSKRRWCRRCFRVSWRTTGRRPLLDMDLHCSCSYAQCDGSLARCLGILAECDTTYLVKGFCQNNRRQY
jgi:hypothetical protein